ncbi:MAG: DsbA family protein [Alistipes sp.]|nr:DsbA family protein [Alistipes sp.]
MDKITIYQFTDPICVWSWGNEPVMRAIDFLYGDKVNTEYIMGGLVEDISTLYDIKAPKEDVIQRANAIIAKNWNDASKRHGMPVITDNFPFFTERYPSSFPQNIAYEAAKRINSKQAKLFLRFMRETTFTMRHRTSQIDVLLNLASKAGFDASTFIDEYTIGHAQTSFNHDRMVCRRNGITGFPSYLIKNDDTNIIIGGYQNLSTFHTVINRLSAGRIKPRRIGPSKHNVIDFVSKYEYVYPVEIEVVFGLDRHQTSLIISELISSNQLTSEVVGNSYRLMIPASQSAKHQLRKNSPQNKITSKRLIEV